VLEERAPVAQATQTTWVVLNRRECVSVVIVETKKIAQPMLAVVVVAAVVGVVCTLAPWQWCWRQGVGWWT
jgi:hypothetical protein